jgi:hypothetical protein
MLNGEKCIPYMGVGKYKPGEKNTHQGLFRAASILQMETNVSGTCELRL